MQKQLKMDELYVNQAVNNMGYIYKQQAKQFIISFLANETSFRPFDAVRNIRDTIISFIELRGFIQIGKNHYHEIVIGLPNNYPQGPPIILLLVNRALFRINKEQQMIMNKQILLEKNETGVQFVRFNFPFLSNSWRPMTPLNDLYKHFQTIVSQPPILVEISVKKYNQWDELNQTNRQVNNMNANNNVGSSKGINLSGSNNLPGLMNLIDSKSVELSNIFSVLNQLQSNQQDFTYQQSRNDYLLNQHLKQLQSNLKSKSDQLCSKTQQVKQILTKASQKSTCDDFLIISPKDLIKLENISQRQALKQGEKKVKQTLQKQLQNGKKYSQYKKLVRTLFSQMYQNQSKILQTAQ